MATLDEQIAEIQGGTPEGWMWRVFVEWEFGIPSTNVVLKRPEWYRFGKFSKSRWIRERDTAEDFTKDVVEMALAIVEDIARRAATPDWAKLAEQLQEALNAK
jgi:hypothetical protein